MSTPPKLLNDHSPRRRALLFVLPVVLAVSLLAGAIAYRQGALESFDNVSFVADSATGISKGMPVKLKGLAIGIVQDVLPRSGSAANEMVMQVNLLINRRHSRFVASDATVSLAQDGLIGQAYLDIGVGKSARAIANGESISYQRKRSLGELAERLSDDARPILQDMSTLAKALADPEGDTRLLLKSARETVAALPLLAQRTQRAIGETEASIVALRTQSTATLQQTTLLMQRADAVLAKVDQAAPALLQSADTTLAHAEKAAAGADQLIKGLEPPVQALLAKGQQGADTAVEILDGAAQTWPVSAVLPAPGYRSALPEAAYSTGIIRPRKDGP